MMQQDDNQYLDQQRLNIIINSMSDAVIATDEVFSIQLFNAATLNLLDVNNIKIGQSIDSILHIFNKDDKEMDLINLIKKSNLSKTYEKYLLKYIDQSKINLSLSITPIRSSYGKNNLNGYIIILRDITRNKSLEEERDEFISVVSHELRTPIAITEGAISNAMAFTEKFDDKVKVLDFLDQAHKQSLYLADLINDLSTLSRAERGVLEIKREEIDVNLLLNEILNNYSSEARNKSLRLEISSSSPTLKLYSTELYVREILQNFVTNAIKYSNTGIIQINGIKSDKGVTFSIKDQGIGISKSDQEKVFNKFFRSEDFRTRKSNGTGLGLYVTAKLAKLIGAKISLESRLNHGSTFSIFVPDLEESN